MIALVSIVFSMVLSGVVSYYDSLEIIKNSTMVESEYIRSDRGVVLTRDQILTKIWDYNYSGETRTVDVHIRTLRQKLGAMGGLIETVRGVGYRIAEKAAKPAEGGHDEA